MSLSQAEAERSLLRVQRAEQALAQERARCAQLRRQLESLSTAAAAAHGASEGPGVLLADGGAASGGGALPESVSVTPREEARVVGGPSGGGGGLPSISASPNHFLSSPANLSGLGVGGSIFHTSSEPIPVLTEVEQLQQELAVAQVMQAVW